MATYDWPAAKDRTLLGKAVSRLDGPAKVTGIAKYAFDVSLPGMLHAKLLTCPHAHADIVSIDTERARALPGVKVVKVLEGPGKTIRWAHAEIAIAVAEREEQAMDAVRAIDVEYVVKPAFVGERNLDAAPETRDGEERLEGDPYASMAEAAGRTSGTYGLPSVSHACLESHGQVCAWEGDQLTVWASTQAVSVLPHQFAEALGVSASDVRIRTEYMGGGFGSKFNPDRWGIECARLAKETRRPVKLMLDRDAEQAIAGDRPSAYARVRAGADADGNLTAWISESWGSGGLAGSGSPPLPYVFRIPNVRHRHRSVPTNVAGSRAWRAPNHPQACLITMTALEDVAASLGMDPLEFFRKNLALTGARAKTYAEEFAIADDLMGWSARWRPRGSQKGVRRRGLGLSLHTWGGRGHNSRAEVSVQPDGSIEVRIGTQDLGTGTRTVVGMVVAETFMRPLEAVTVRIGDSRFPASGPSGGSTTVGGVSASCRRAAVDARDTFLQAAAKAYRVPAASLSLDPSGLRGAAAEAIPFADAARHALGAKPISASGANPGKGRLTDSGVGGVQMAEVEVDVETGVVKVRSMAAVQDCGLVIDLKTAESQVHGGLIMGISYALCEEKTMDPVTGRMLNPDFEFYRIARYPDVGELKVHMMTGPGYDERGVIGLGEPPVISPGAAISNAVANAIGVRVHELPLTPDRVLDALAGAEEG